MRQDLTCAVYALLTSKKERDRWLSDEEILRIFEAVWRTENVLRSLDAHSERFVPLLAYRISLAELVRTIATPSVDHVAFRRLSDANERAFNRLVRS